MINLSPIGIIIDGVSTVGFPTKSLMAHCCQIVVSVGASSPSQNNSSPLPSSAGTAISPISTYVDASHMGCVSTTADQDVSNNIGARYWAYDVGVRGVLANNIGARSILNQ